MGRAWQSLSGGMPWTGRMQRRVPACSRPMSSHLKVCAKGTSRFRHHTAAAGTLAYGSGTREKADHRSAAMPQNAGQLNKQAKGGMGQGKLPYRSHQPQPGNGGLGHPRAGPTCLQSATIRKRRAAKEKASNAGPRRSLWSNSSAAVRAHAEPARSPHMEEVPARGMTSGGTTTPVPWRCCVTRQTRDGRIAVRSELEPVGVRASAVRFKPCIDAPDQRNAFSSRPPAHVAVRDGSRFLCWATHAWPACHVAMPGSQGDIPATRSTAPRRTTEQVGRKTGKAHA